MQPEPELDTQVGSDLLATKTTLLPDGIVVTTQIDKKGVRLSTVTDSTGVVRWLKSDGQKLVASDGVQTYERDLSEMLEQEMRKVEAHFAATSTRVDGKAVRVSVERETDNAGHTKLLLRETSGTNKWSRFNLDTRELETFDGTTLTRRQMPRPALVPHDLDTYNRSVPQALRLVTGHRVDYSNGCGSEGGIGFPDGNWVEACNEHDDCYDGMGSYTFYTRSQCDTLLFDMMVDSGPIGAIFAPLYWIAVTLFGESSFDASAHVEPAGDSDEGPYGPENDPPEP